MDNRLIKKLLHYGLIQFGIAAIILYFIHPYIYYGIWDPLVGSVFHLFDRRGTSNAEAYAFICVLIALWVFCYFVYLRQRLYRDQTGRSYSYDHGKYNRSYGELVEYFKDAEPQRMDKNELPDITWHESRGIIMGKCGSKLISFEPEVNGTVVFAWGAPGVGKTKCVIVPSTRQWGLTKVRDKETGQWKLVQRGSVMVLDLKGDIYDANKDYRRIKRFSTIHVEDSYHYDPLITARSMDEEDLPEFFDNLAVTLVPDEAGTDAAYFIKVARGFFTAIFLFCLHEDINRSFGDICLDITTHTYAEWGQRIEESQYLPSMKYSNRFKDENPKNVGGGYSKLCDSLLLYTSTTMKKLLINDRKCISPDDLEHCRDIYIQIDPNKMDVYAPLVAMLFQVFMSATLQRKEGANPPIAYIIDEFGQLPRMPVIQKSAMLMRAYNASIMISTQAMASIDQHYGQDGRKLLMDCAKAHCFLSINDPDTRDWASRLIGTHKVLKIGNSQSHSTTETNSKTVSEAREKIFEPEAFSLLPDDHSVIIWKSGHFIKGETCYYKS